MGRKSGFQRQKTFKLFLSALLVDEIEAIITVTSPSKAADNALILREEESCFSPSSSSGWTWTVLAVTLLA